MGQFQGANTLYKSTVKKLHMVVDRITIVWCNVFQTFCYCSGGSPLHRSESVSRGEGSYGSNLILSAWISAENEV